MAIVDEFPVPTLRCRICVFLALAAISTVSGRYPTQAAETKVTAQMEGPPLIVDVDPLAQDSSSEKHFAVSVDEKLRAIFGEETPILWAPHDVQQPLKVVRFGETGAASEDVVSLGVGSQGSSQISIAFDRPPLLGDAQRQLTLRVQDASKLVAGVYEGKIVSHMRTLKTDAVVEYSWPVVLRVRGRRIVQVQFSAVDPRAKAPVLRVGLPASIKVTVQTVDCDLGSGRLDLTLKEFSQAKDAPKTVLKLPLKSPGWIDPKMDLPTLATPDCKDPFCHDEWLDQLLRMDIASTSRKIAHGKEVAQHDILVQLPQVFAIGDWRAQVQWAAATTPRQAYSLTSERVLSALPGIRVWPELAAVSEPVYVRVVADSDLGDSLPLTVLGPAGAAPQSLMAKRDPAARKALPQGSVSYFVRMTLPSLGKYSVGLATNADDKQKAALPYQTEFNVPFKRINNLNAPLVVFIGAPPFWWDFTNGSQVGGGWQAKRTPAFALRSNSDDMSKLQGELKAIVAMRGRDEDHVLSDPVHWQREPQFSFPDGSSTDKGELRVYVPASKAKQPSAAPLKQWTTDPKDNTLKFDLNASVMPREPQGEESARHVVGDRDYKLRLLVTGSGPGGSELGRVYNIPLRVQVTTDWAYYWPAIGWASITIGGLSAIGLACWLINRRLSPAVSVAPLAEPTSPAGGAFEPGEGLGSPPGRASAPAASPHPAAASNVPAASEFAGTDDSWLNVDSPATSNTSSSASDGWGPSD